eukprot:m.118546 g.118546  ORF g.118546 m.118546 type:complete len:1861 (+) comp14514_c1_seq1:75-5657(+)
MAAFPRGGQPLLPTLARRSLARQAEEDATVEMETGKSKRLFEDPEEAEDFEANESSEEETTQKPNTKKRTANKEDGGVSKKLKVPEGKQVHFLTHQRLVPGMKLLGAVRTVRKTEVTISLANGHSATAMLEDVSAPLAAAVTNTSNASPDTAMRLRDVLVINQLIACVVSDESASGEGGAVRVTLHPEAVNAGCDPSFLTKGRLVWAVIASMQDRGCLLDVGITGLSVFVPTKEMAPLAKAQGKPLLVGQPVFCVVTSEADGGRSIKATLDPARVAVARATASHHPTLASMAPGELVECAVTAASPSGLTLSFCDFQGEVDSMHLPEPTDDATTFIHKKGMGRIVFINASANQIGVSMRPALVAMHVPEPALAAGARVDATIVSATKGRGVLAQLPDALGFCSVKGMAEDPATVNFKKFKAGSTRPCRVISFNAIDGMYRLTFKEASVETDFYSLDDVKPGMELKATIGRVGDDGLHLDLSKHVYGVCPPMHMADVALKHPEKKFTVGTEVTCRVLSTSEHGKRKLTLTLKRSLLKSELPQLTSHADAVVGAEYHGFVSALKPYGCFVTFYNNVGGLVPRDEISSSAAHMQVEEMVKIGQVVRCRVLEVNAAERRMRLTMRLENTVNPAALRAVPTGSLVDVVVTRVFEEGLEVAVGEAKLPGMIATEQLADQPGLAERLLRQYQVDMPIKDVLVLAHETKPTLHLALSLKPALKAAAAALPASLDALQPGQRLLAYVRTVTEHGIFINMVHGLSGLARRRQVAGARELLTRYSKGQTILVDVDKIDKEENKVFFSIKPVDADATRSYAESLLTTLNALSATPNPKYTSLAVGGADTFTVDSVKEFGYLGKLSDGHNALVTKEQAREPLTPGSQHACVIIDVDRSKGLVDVSLSPALIAAVAAKGKGKSKGKGKGAAAGPVGASFRATVEAVKEEYAIVSSADGTICVFPTKTFNDHSSPFKRFVVGRGGQATGLAEIEGRTVVAFEQDAVDGPAKAVVKAKAAAKEVAAPELGDVADAHINAIKDFQMNIQIGKTKGRVHITELSDDVIEGPAFAAYKPGMTVKVKVIGVHKAKTHKALPITHREEHLYDLLECSMRKSIIAGAEPLTISSLQPGQQLVGYVHDIEEECLWLNVTPSLRGRVQRLRAAQSVDAVRDLVSSFRLGQAVPVRVVEVRESPLLLELAATPAPAEGVLLPGRVVKTETMFVTIMLAPHLYGRAHLLDLSDTLPASTAEAVTKGDYVLCRVLKIEGDKIDLSLRASQTQPGAPAPADPLIASPADAIVGNVYRGYVTNVSDVGVYVTLGHNVHARVQISHLSDLFLPNFKKVFQAGSLVRGRILSNDDGRIEMSLKASIVDPSSYAPVLSFKDLKQDMIVTGAVKRVESFGLFITLGHPRLCGLCHISEVTSDKSPNLKALYKEGDLVRAVIIKLDPETKKISLSLKSRLLRTDAADETDNAAAARMRVLPSGKRDWLAGTAASVPEAVAPMEVDSSATKAASTVALEYNSDEEDVELPRKRKHDAAGELAAEGFAWQPDALDALLRGHAGDNDEPAQAEQEEQAGAKKMSKRAKKAVKDAEEDRIRAAEQEALRNDAPQTADAFDRALLASPDSSLLWVKYMAFHLQMTELDKARRVAEKALRTISYRQDAERMNVWVARLNLEAAYGTPETTTKVFAEAVAANDALQMHLHMAAIYTRREQPAEADAVYQTMLKKFRETPRVWVQYAQWLMRQGEADKVRDLLQRALQSLPKSEHVAIIVQFALLEFKEGSPERARTVFESVLANYPKRVDVWNVLLDQELRVGDATATRALFERITTLSLSTKKMKHFFKRYLEFEKSQDNEAGVEHVKAKARAYVEDKMA